MDRTKTNPSVPATDHKPMVLVVEDEVLTGLSMAAMLETVGCTAIGPAYGPAAAMTLLDRQTCDLVLLDVNQAVGSATRPLVDRLRADGTPVLVTSPGRPAFLVDAPRLPKPVAAHAMVSAARAALP